MHALMMGAEMVLETLVSYRHLMQLMAQEDFIKFSCWKSSRSCIVNPYQFLKIEKGHYHVPQKLHSYFLTQKRTVF
jgi:hypothetical protein